jgi:hypothetical protein
VLKRVTTVSGDRAISPTTVRNAVRYFIRERDGVKRSSKESASSFDVMMDSRRLSPGALRDLSVNLAGVYVTKNKLGSPDATDEAWAKSTVSTAWYAILGVAMASGDSLVPERVECEDNLDPEAPTSAMKIGRQYAFTAFLRAIIRSEVNRRFNVGRYSAWTHATVTTDKGTNRTRSHEIHRAIKAIVTEDTTGNLKAMFTAVWHDLVDAGIIPRK